MFGNRHFSKIIYFYHIINKKTYSFVLLFILTSYDLLFYFVLFPDLLGKFFRAGNL